MTRVGSSFDAANKYVMSEVMLEKWKHRPYRFGLFELTLVLSFSERGRFVEVERGNAICRRTQVVSFMAFKRSSILISSTIPACLTARAHHPSARITTKKPLAVPLSSMDHSGFSGTSRDNTSGS
jgi:hypothetical protein